MNPSERALRKRLAAAFIVVAAVVGTILRASAERGSATYDFGTLLMVMWIPVVSFVVFYFATKRKPVPAPPPSFSVSVPFVAHVRVRIDARTGPGSDKFTSDARYYFLLGTEGFSVRLRPQPVSATSFEGEFLVPALALPRFPAGTAFRVFDGTNVVADGEVNEVLHLHAAPAPDAR